MSKGEKSQPRPPSEVALVCAARQGDTKALARLLQDNWLWLKALVYNILGNVTDVDDTLQDLCLSALKHISELREPERFQAWLAAIARNAAQARRRKRLHEVFRWEDFRLRASAATGPPGPLELLTRQENQRLLLEAVHRLPEKYREVFLLKYLDELSYARIGEILDLPVTTVQIRLVRARRMLYNRLTGKTAHKVPRT